MEGKRLLQEIRSRPLAIVPGKKVVSRNPGEWTSPFEGKGYEPRGYRDFVLGDNPRLLHLPTSARRGVPTIVERVALRDVKLLIVVDLSASMRVRDKQRIQHEAAAMLLYSAWQAETTFGLAASTGNGIHGYGLGVGSRHFYRCFALLWALSAVTATVRGTRVQLRRCLPPGAMLAYCSDFLDADGGLDGVAPLLRACARYDLVPVVIQDGLECSFPSAGHAGLAAFASPESAAAGDLWITPASAEYIADQHARRFAELVHRFAHRNVRHVHLDAPGVSRVHAALDGYFRARGA